MSATPRPSMAFSRLIDRAYYNALKAQNDAMREALAELLAVSAGAMRVLARYSLADEFEHELRALRIQDGFGVRAQAALALGKTDGP